MAKLKPYPKYKGKKNVSALEIERVELKESGGAALYPADETYQPFMVDPKFVAANKLDELEDDETGYYVVEQKGEKSFISVAVFEDMFSPIGKGKK